MSDDDENDFILESDSSSRLSNGSWNHNFAAHDTSENDASDIYLFFRISLSSHYDEVSVTKWEMIHDSILQTPCGSKSFSLLAMDDESIACT